MAFSFYDEESGRHYSSDLWGGLFAQRRNLVSPRFWRLLFDIRRFYRRALLDLDRQAVGKVSLGEYLAAGGFREDFIRDHILPMGAAIWSTPPAEMMSFPAASFLHFFRNHGLLELDNRPQWMTLVGGSRSYVRRIAETFAGEVRLNSPVVSVARGAEGVQVRARDGESQSFDRVVLAAHADESLALLKDADDEERRWLGPWTYSRNETVLHRDESAMPPSRDAWASWNFIRERGASDAAPASVTYYMNRLQQLKTEYAWLVSLNRRRPVPDEYRVRTFLYTHPTYTAASMATQRDLPSLNGRRGTFFCGSYFGYGFHEDAVKSGAAVARQMGVEWGPPA